MAGSPTLFAAARTRPVSIDYVTCHDGFTLADLVSHERKHNHANLEDNRDGADGNLSRNWGAEGADQRHGHPPATRPRATQSAGQPGADRRRADAGARRRAGAQPKRQQQRLLPRRPTDLARLAAGRGSDRVAPLHPDAVQSASSARHRRHYRTRVAEIRRHADEPGRLATRCRQSARRQVVDARCRASGPPQRRRSRGPLRAAGVAARDPLAAAAQHGAARGYGETLAGRLATSAAAHAGAAGSGVRGGSGGRRAGGVAEAAAGAESAVSAEAAAGSSRTNS